MGLAEPSAPAPLGATLLGSPEWNPSGIPSAAVVNNCGALVSSGFPSRQSLSGSPLLRWSPLQAPPAPLECGAAACWGEKIKERGGRVEPVVPIPPAQDSESENVMWVVGFQDDGIRYW